MLLLEVAALAAFTVPIAAARDSFDFRVSQPRRLVAINKPSPNHVTSNTISLGRANSKTNSLSAGYLAAIRAGNHVDGVYSRLRNGTADLLSVGAGSVFLAPLDAGGETFYVVIDTGSSDTWLINNEFTCVDPSDSSSIPEDQCSFGPTYTLTSTASQIDNRNFNISYADGERLNGQMITEDLTFAGITVENQTMGLVTEAGWYGDGASSGLLGLAYSSLTNQYNGDDPTTDIRGLNVPYDPLFTNMYAQNLTSPLFSIALDRDIARSAQAQGGVLAVGGIPDIPHGTAWASANISVVGIDATTGQPEYQFYSIRVDGWAISADWSADFDIKTTGNQRKVPLLGAPTRNAIVDSGTSLIYAPSAVAAGVAAAFSPAAAISSQTGLYHVDCNAIVPRFGVVVSSKIFFVNRLDMIIDTGLGFCVLGVQDNNGGLTILGDVFMRNVLTVFDVGGGVVRFSARECQLTNGTITQ